MRRSLFHRLALAAALGLLACAAPALAGPEHESVLRIGADEPLPVTRHVKLGLNKSMLIEIPGELRDVVVSNPKLLDAVAHSNNRAYLIGMGVGEANAFFFDRTGQQILTLEVSIDRDLSAISDLMARLIPGSRIHVEAINENIVLTGNVINAADASRAADIASRFVKEKENVLNMIAAESKEQVLLKVTVVEMNRSISKQLGVNLDGNVGIGTSVLGFGSNPALGLPNILNPSTTGNLPGGNGIGLGINGKNGSGVINLRALEQDGLAHVLAEPNLTAISGETANFLAGGEFPVPVPQDSGNGSTTLTVEFKKFGVGLNFTPLVLSEGRISLKISTEVSELTNEGAVVLNGFTVPALKVRRAETVVELPSGGSLAMAGLLSDNTKNAVSGLPGIKNLPVLGTLFRSRDYLKNETELVVMVTPYIVKSGVARHELVRPDKGFAQSTDEQAYLFGRLNRIYGREPEGIAAGSIKDAPATKAGYGFIVD